MYSSKSFELPSNLKQKFKKVKKMEWITIGYLLSVAIVMYLVTGSSQAMKSAWLEDVLSIVPSIAFLISAKIYDKKANKRFPYGYHRVFGIAYLTGGVALFSMGIFLIVDSFITLVFMEHPTIGSTVVFGHHIWLGWVMIAALLYSAIPAVILGRKKLPLANELHNKILFTDADTQKADYMTAVAAMIGVLGVGYGLWWLDAVMAILISISVISDGYKNLKNAIEDLMDRRPQKVNSKGEDPLLEELTKLIERWDWIEDFEARFREHGQVYFCEIKVVSHVSDISHYIKKSTDQLEAYHWKVHEVFIMPVQKL